MLEVVCVDLCVCDYSQVTGARSFAHDLIHECGKQPACQHTCMSQTVHAASMRVHHEFGNRDCEYAFC